MSELDDFSVSLEGFSGTTRLFPLPNLVLFPHVLQPLHVFEPRYRESLDEALAGDNLMAMATLAPGWESDYEGRPPLYPFACLARIVLSHKLGDGTSNVMLMGLERIKIVRELSPYSKFSVPGKVSNSFWKPNRREESPTKTNCGRWRSS